MKRGIVLAADPTEPHRVVSWEGRGAFLPLAYREIGVESGVDSCPIIWTPLGPVHYWCDDTGLLRPRVEHNDRAIALFRHLGYDVPDVPGTIVIVGGVTPDHDVDGLDARLLEWLDIALTTVTAALSEPTGGTDG